MRSFTAVALVCVIAQQTASAQASKVPMSESAEQYIAAFKRGEDYKSPPTGVVLNGRPDEAAVARLTKELAVAEPQVREQIVHLLVDLARRTDPLTPKGADVVRHPSIVAALAGPGLAKSDVGRNGAMDALRRLVTVSDLARYEGEIARTLGAPSADVFLLIAKAKAMSTRERVERLSNMPEWKDVEAVRIARAALGDRGIEDKYMARMTAAEAASDGPGLAAALSKLGLIGTERCLRAIGERVRTPLIIQLKGSYDKSVRLDALEALLYNYPDEPVLYPNNIIKEEDYAAAERFCTERLGVVYRNTRPPFLTYFGHPHVR
jgi:hypothetical protein